MTSGIIGFWKAISMIKYDQGTYFIGIKQGNQQKRVGSSGVLATLCHMKVKMIGRSPYPIK